MSFTKRAEDFHCEHCGARVAGNGYTNHCPNCLWSKHVDKDPGDRKETCGGMMQPVAIEGTSPNYRIVHKCLTCGAIRRINASKEDDRAVLIALSGGPVIMN